AVGLWFARSCTASTNPNPGRLPAKSGCRSWRSRPVSIPDATNRGSLDSLLLERREGFPQIVGFIAVRRQNALGLLRRLHQRRGRAGVVKADGEFPCIRESHLSRTLPNQFLVHCPPPFSRHHRAASVRLLRPSVCLHLIDVAATGQIRMPVA